MFPISSHFSTGSLHKNLLTVNFVHNQASRPDLPDRPPPPVTIYRLITKGTIEEKIIRLYHTKKDLVDSFLEGTGLIIIKY